MSVSKRRTPHGVRGLKCKQGGQQYLVLGSHPAWGAWIEISRRDLTQAGAWVAPRMGCVD